MIASCTYTATHLGHVEPLAAAGEYIFEEHFMFSAVTKTIGINII